MDEAAGGLLGVLGEELAQQRRLDRAGAERVDAHAAARELDAELACQRQHAALRGGVGDLRGRGAHHGDERRRVDDRATAALEQVRDAVLAAQEDRLEVDVLHPLPCLQRRFEHRRVVVGGDARVVEEHVDAAELVAHARVHVTHRCLVGDVDLERQVAGRTVVQVDADDASALARERLGGCRSDAPGRAGDHAHLPVQATRHRHSSVA